MRATLSVCAAVFAVGCGHSAVPTTPASSTDIPIAGAADASATGARFDFIAIDGNDVWVTDYKVPELIRIDGNTARIVGRVPLPKGVCKTIAAGGGAVWVARCTERAILKIDPKTMAVAATFSVNVSSDSEAMVAFAADSVWVVGDKCSDGNVLLRIDPTDGHVIAEISIPIGSRGIAATRDSIWVTSPQENVVTRVDIATNTPVDPVDVGWAPRFIAADDRAVWVLNQGDGSVAHLDARSGTVTAKIETPALGLGGDIATDGGSVWVRSIPAFLIRIDAATNRIVARYGPAQGSGGVRAADKHAWVTAHKVQTIWRLPM